MHKRWPLYHPLRQRRAACHFRCGSKQSVLHSTRLERLYSLVLALPADKMDEAFEAEAFLDVESLVMAIVVADVGAFHDIQYLR